MNKKLYVGNLPFGADEASIRTLFEGEGFPVASVKIMMDRETGRSRGFGFAELTTPEDDVKAAERLNGLQYMGRPLIVNEAQDRPPREGGGFGGPRPGGFSSGPRPVVSSGGAPSGLPKPNGPGGPPPRPVGGFGGPRPGGAGGFSGGGGFSRGPRESGGFGGGSGFGSPPPFDPATDPAAAGAPRGRDHNRGKDKDRKKRGRDDDWS